MEPREADSQASLLLLVSVGFVNTAVVAGVGGPGFRFCLGHCKLIRPSGACPENRDSTIPSWDDPSDKGLSMGSAGSREKKRQNERKGSST